MKTLRTITTATLLSLALFGVAACTPTNTASDAVSLTRPADELRTMLIGTWYGKQPLDGGGTYEFVNTRRTNATYSVTFRVTGPDGRAETHTETGHWGASADHFYTTFKAFEKDGTLEYVNPMDTKNYDVYEVLDLDSDEMTYRHLASGTVFTAKRVDEGFKLP